MANNLHLLHSTASKSKGVSYMTPPSAFVTQPSGNAPGVWGRAPTFDKRLPSRRALQTESMVVVSVAMLSSLKSFDCQILDKSAPLFDYCDEPLETPVWHIELVPWKSVETIEHLSKHLRVEASVLVQGAFTKVFETVAISDRREVDEVSSLCSSEHSKDFVDGELLSGEDWTEFSSFNGQDPGVRSQVDFRHLVMLPHFKANETRSLPNATDIHPGVLERFLDGRHQSVDILRSRAEEIEIPGLTFDVTSGDQRATAGKGELLRLRKSADDCCNSTLERRQHATSTLRCCRIHSAQAWRTGRGNTSSSHRSIS